MSVDLPSSTLPQVMKRSRLWCATRALLEVAFDLLLFHRRRLIVIDHAPLTLGVPRLHDLLDDRRNRVRAAVDRSSQRVATERSKPHLPHLGRFARLKRH